ncbi:MAG: hypothetical protein WDA72_07145, partial [Desulfomonilia bacterium]
FFPSLSDHGFVAILAPTKPLPGNQVPGKCPEPPVKQGMEPRELGSNPRFPTTFSLKCEPFLSNKHQKII